MRSMVEGLFAGGAVPRQDSPSTALPAVPLPRRAEGGI